MVSQSFYDCAWVKFDIKQTQFVAPEADRRTDPFTGADMQADRPDHFSLRLLNSVRKTLDTLVMRGFSKMV